MNILLCTGNEKINNVIISAGYTIVGIAERTNDILPLSLKTTPELILVSNQLCGEEKSEQLINLIIKIKNNLTNTRILYLYGYIDMSDTVKLSRLSSLVSHGIYDIYHEKSITPRNLITLINNPKKEEDVQYLTLYLNKNKESEIETSFESIEKKENLDDVRKYGYRNVTMFSSLKPGSGKSFLSVNIATAIAEYGESIDGKPPKVAIIEGDLQNLSVGTLLHSENDKYNIKTASKQIDRIIDTEGNLIGNEKEILEVNSFIKKCFIKCPKVKNLYALSGSQLKREEADTINPYAYIYIIESVLEDFDVIIVDTNSSISHKTTYPLLKLSRNVYYIVNLDFNNIRNNQRLKGEFSNLGVNEKIKYILNEDVEDVTVAKSSKEELMFKSDVLNKKGFNFVARVPLIDMSIMLNRIYLGTPLILDDNDYTLKARIEILKVANEIWPINGINDLVDSYNIYLKKGQKKWFFK